MSDAPSSSSLAATSASLSGQTEDGTQTDSPATLPSGPTDETTTFVVTENPLESKLTAPKVDFFVSDTVQVPATAMYPLELAPGLPRKKNVAVPASWQQFGIKPKFWGTNIVYCNADDEALYDHELFAPALIVWVLIQDFKGTYVKRRLIEEALLMNIQIKLVDPSNFDLVVSRDGVHTVTYRGERLALPDGCIVRVGAVVDYFGLAVIRQLEQLGVEMFNDFNSVTVSRDKCATYQTLSANGVPVPKSILSKVPVDVGFLGDQLGWPMIVKHPSGSQGEQVWKCTNVEELTAVVEQHGCTDVPLIFQHYVRSSTGRDIRAFVVGGQLIAAYMRINKAGFKSNIHQGGVGKLIKVDPELEALVLRAAELCGLHVAGIDIMMDSDDGTYKICECNSSPGFEGVERYSGINVARSILSYVSATLALRKWNRLQHRRRKQAKEFVRTPIQPDHVRLGLDTASDAGTAEDAAAAATAAAAADAVSKAAAVTAGGGGAAAQTQ